jgi:rhomboid family GlyGly-CTERM serine protease
MAASIPSDLASKTQSTHLLKASPLGIKGSIWAWTILLLIVNLPLAWGEVRTSLIFLPEAVRQGQWWRVVTFPLVHLSWYHFLLDGCGFLLLFGCLEEQRWLAKTLYVVGAGAGALLLSLALDPSIATQGLCGLSSIAHGLMAISALEMLRHEDQRKWGWISLSIVVGKSAYELWAGHVLFEFLHMGLCGHPLAACHAGGVLGAMIAFVPFHLRTGHLFASHLGTGRMRPGHRIFAGKAFAKGTKDGAPQATVIQSLLGSAVRLLTRIIYRVRYRGLENIPEKGGAVLVCNHVTYVDWLIIASACRRPVHFVMHASIYRHPLVHWILRLGKAIPIASGRKNPVALRHAFDKIAQVLDDGGLVCLFPEGHLTRTGRIDRFRPGIERIIRQTPVPVVPLAVCGMWGSFFSHKNGPAMRCRPRKPWLPVELAVGREVSPCMATACHLRSIVQQLHGPQC